MVRAYFIPEWKFSNIDDRQMLTASEKSSFIEAELCLMEAPSKLGVTGAKTRWDDLQYNHVVQTHVVHDVVCPSYTPDQPGLDC